MNKWVPNRKISAAGIGIPVATILVWLLVSGGINVPADVATAIGGLISTLLGYFVPERIAQR